MRRQLLTAARMLAVLTVLVGLAYPLAVMGVAQTLFHHQANGSVVTDAQGRVVGSELLGQTFTSPRYFWGRPSAAGAAASGTLGEDGQAADLAVPGNLNSGGSNLGPSNEVLITSVQERVATYRSANGLAAEVEVPVDAVTASGSGVDPHISVANARLQAPRVAAERAIPTDRVLALIDEHVDGRSFGVLGESGVNVLTLNVALDRG